VPVQPTSAEFGETAVDVQTTTEADAKAAATAPSSDSATECQAAAAGKAAKPQGKEPPTNEFPSIKLIGSWGEVTGETDPGGSASPGRNGGTQGQAAGHVRLTAPPAAAPATKNGAAARQPVTAGKAGKAQTPAEGDRPAKADARAKAKKAADAEARVDADDSAASGLTVTIEPAAADGADTQPAKAKPTVTKAAVAEASSATPAKAKTGPAKAVPAKAVPAKTVPAKPAAETAEPAATSGAAAASQTVVRAEPAAAAAASTTKTLTPGRPAPDRTAVAPAAGQAGWRAPGLDGVRALAVLAVLAFHEGLPWIPGGFLGVDVFFVLSGYLITDLLVARYRKHGNIGLGRFYQRRARRLLPALALMLLVVTAAASLLEPSQRSTLRPALLGAVTYTSNWWQALAHQSYFSLYGPPPVFQHLWSLAVEEQFYLIWPLMLAVILMLVHRPVTRALCAWGGAAAAALLMLAMYTPGSDPSLVYYGTDTHASALMIGAALAITWPLAKIAATAGRARHVLDLVGGAGLVVLAWSVWRLSGPDPFVYPYGLVLAALAAGGLILAAAAPGRIGGLLSWRPLRWLGVRSYGIYLWHWPVIAITTGIAPRSATSAPVRLIDTVLPVVLAAASWHWLEAPILRNGLRAELRRWGRLLALGPRGIVTTPSAAVPGLTAVALIAVAGTAGYGLVNAHQPSTLQTQITRAQRVISSTLPPQPSGEATPWWLVPGRMPFHLATRTKAPKPKAVHVPGTRVMAIGDSVMLASAPELAASMPGIYINAKVSRAMIAGIAIVDQLARDKRLRKVVIVGLGTNGPIASSQIRALRAAIGDRWLVLVNTFVPRSWEREVNTTIAKAAKRYPNVLLVNWHNAIEHHQGLLWGDDIHPQPIGGKLYAKVVRKVVLHALHKRPRLSVPHRRVTPAHLSGFLLHAIYATLY
jgi:peptidoglycan/LPS O-acetylase OafA/YrhL